jgi:hypothetical protein
MLPRVPIITIIKIITVIYSFLLIMKLEHREDQMGGGFSCSLPRRVFEMSGQSRMVSSGMLHHVALVRTDVSEELRASFIRVTRISELGTTLAVTSNRHTLRRNCHPDERGTKILRNVGSYKSHTA